MKRRSVLFAPALLLTGCATAQSRPDNAALVKQVTDTELAFAKTMADRDHAAFASFLADETVFLMGGKPQRGKAAVADYWKRFYTEPKAPFPWRPDHVQVLDSASSPPLPDRCSIPTASSSRASTRPGGARTRACGASCSTTAAT